MTRCYSYGKNMYSWFRYKDKIKGLGKLIPNLELYSWRGNLLDYGEVTSTAQMEGIE